MALRMKLRRVSVYWTWLCSYCIVLLIPTISIFINYGMNVRTIKQEYIKANELLLTNIRDGVEYYMERERHFYEYAYSADEFQDLRKYDEIDKSFLHKASVYQKTLSYYDSRQNSISCMVYLTEKEFLITNKEAGSAKDFYRGMKYQYADVVEYDLWMDMLGHEYQNEYFISLGLNKITNAPCLVYAHTIVNSHLERVNIFTSIPLKTIEEMAEPLREGVLLVIQVAGEKEFVLENGSIREVCRENEGQKLILDEEDFVCMEMESEKKGINYKMYIPNEIISKELQGVKRSFYVNLVFTLLLGIVGIVVLMRINYRPVFSLLKEMVDVKEGRKYGWKENEFREIERMYKCLKKEKYNAEQMVEQQKIELKSAWLLSLMKGRTTKVLRQENKDFLEIGLENYVAICSFMIPLEKDVQQDELLFFAVDNIFTELMKDEKFYRVDDGRFIFYLFDLKNESETWREEVMEKMIFLSNLINEKMGVSLMGTVSDIGYSVNQLNFLYQNVISVLEYWSMEGGSGIIDIKKTAGYREEYRIQDYLDKELREAFSERNMDAAYAVSEKIFEDTEKKPQPMIRIYAYELFRIVMDIYREYVPDMVQQTKLLDYLDLLIKSKNVEEMKLSVEQVLQFAGDSILRWKAMEDNTIIVKIKQYVENNYQEYDLNISTMAEGLQINARHISRVFKEEMHMSILDYINKYRVMKAKELMNRKRYTLKEVSSMVGYADERNFRKAFLKEEGIIPSLYS